MYKNIQNINNFFSDFLKTVTGKRYGQAIFCQSNSKQVNYRKYFFDAACFNADKAKLDGMNRKNFYLSVCN
jgi:hypothetical protein